MTKLRTLIFVLFGTAWVPVWAGPPVNPAQQGAQPIGGGIKKTIQAPCPTGQKRKNGQCVGKGAPGSLLNKGGVSPKTSKPMALQFACLNIKAVELKIKEIKPVPGKTKQVQVVLNGQARVAKSGKGPLPNVKKPLRVELLRKVNGTTQLLDYREVTGKQANIVLTPTVRVPVSQGPWPGFEFRVTGSVKSVDCKSTDNVKSLSRKTVQAAVRQYVKIQQGRFAKPKRPLPRQPNIAGYQTGGSGGSVQKFAGKRLTKAPLTRPGKVSGYQTGGSGGSVQKSAGKRTRVAGKAPAQIARGPALGQKLRQGKKKLPQVDPGAMKAKRPLEGATPLILRNPGHEPRPPTAGCAPSVYMWFEPEPRLGVPHGFFYEDESSTVRYSVDCATSVSIFNTEYVPPGRGSLTDGGAGAVFHRDAIADGVLTGDRRIEPGMPTGDYGWRVSASNNRSVPITSADERIAWSIKNHVAVPISASLSIHTLPPSTWCRNNPGGTSEGQVFVRMSYPRRADGTSVPAVLAVHLGGGERRYNRALGAGEFSIASDAFPIAASEFCSDWCVDYHVEAGNADDASKVDSSLSSACVPAAER